jgi:hypothetical protein
MELEVHELTVAATPPKVTVLVPWVEPKLLPVIIRTEPVIPEVLDRVIVSASTVSDTVAGAGEA